MGAADHKVGLPGLHVDWDGPNGLIGIDNHLGTVSMSDLDNGGNIDQCARTVEAVVQDQQQRLVVNGLDKALGWLANTVRRGDHHRPGAVPGPGLNIIAQGGKGQFGVQNFIALAIEVKAGQRGVKQG